MPLSTNHLQKLSAIVGAAHCKTDQTTCQTYGKDWTHLTGEASCVLFPATTQEVSAILTYCHAENLAVIPSGGRTGLAGAAVATQGEIVIALDRMNKILLVDAIGLSITAESGAIIQNLQQKAREHGLFYPVDLASKGSCQLGGNIATNAGGLKLIRFGGTREQVLGLEIVLANGDILDLNLNLRKDNSGYDLKQLFIGSEGTLGIITKATMKLVQQPRDLKLAVLGCQTFEHVLRILQLCNQRGIQPTAFEYLTQQALNIVLKHHPEVRAPFSEAAAFYVLLEIENLGAEALQRFEALLEETFTLEIAQDAVLAQSSQQFHDLWKTRELISESVAQHGFVRKNDVTIPIAQLGQFQTVMEQMAQTCPAYIELVLFGHIGDGNIHINYVGQKSKPASQFLADVQHIEHQVFATIAKLRGSISAEHGIGLIKKPELAVTRTPEMIQWQRSIKRLFDPKGILNPGKIFDL